MSKKLAVITIHGMGDTNPNYYKAFEKKLRKYVGHDLWDNNVHLEDVFYQDLLQERQEDYWNEIDDKYSLNWDFLRKFMLFSFSDAASIEHSLRNDLKLYKNVHKKIADAFDISLKKLKSPNNPVIVVAHSLGCEQVSNYIWDAMNNKRLFSSSETGTPAQKKFRRLSTCKLFVTTGCNIPIFRAGLDQPKLFKRPNGRFKWVNYFDDHDVLAYPMREMSDAFDVSWIKDSNVRVGGVLTSWNPASHGQYWTDRDVVKPISKEIIRLVA